MSRFVYLGVCLIPQGTTSVIFKLNIWQPETCCIWNIVGKHDWLHSTGSLCIFILAEHSKMVWWLSTDLSFHEAEEWTLLISENRSKNHYEASPNDHPSFNPLSFQYYSKEPPSFRFLTLLTISRICQTFSLNDPNNSNNDQVHMH